MIHIETYGSQGIGGHCSISVITNAPAGLTNPTEESRFGNPGEADLRSIDSPKPLRTSNSACYNVTYSVEPGNLVNTSENLYEVTEMGENNQTSNIYSHGIGTELFVCVW